MRASADSASYTKTALLLLILMAGGLVFRTVFTQAVMPPPDRMQGETTQAYRYAEMVSSGTGIPQVDTLVMRPGGMVTGENSIFEEYLAGGLHRVTGGDFDSFIRLFSRLFPLLTIPVLFFWMRNTGYRTDESLLGSAIYAVFLPALLRSRGESLYRETVALPILLAALMLADISRGRAGRKALLAAAAGGALLFCALAAWKVTGFLSFLLFVWLAFSRADSRTVLPFAAAQLLAALLLTHMRNDGAILSPASVMAAAAAVSSITGKRRAGGLAGIAVALLASVFFPSDSTGHVTAVVLAKLRFLFTHPEDPTLLSTDARLFWVSGYTSPSPGQMLLLFGAAAIPAFAGLRRFHTLSGKSLIYWLFFVSLAGYLFFDRLHVLLAAAIIPPMVAALGRNRYLLAAAVPLFGTLSMLAPAQGELLSRWGAEMGEGGSLLSDSELDEFLQWAGDREGTFLSYWHISGLLSAYADAPTVTHTFFENKENRETIVEFAERIYGSEDDMAEFMEEKGADYLVFQADFTLDRSFQGLLYLAGLTEVPDGSLAVRLHYYPESLERLAPVWQGRSLRVFKLDGEPAEDLDRHVLWEREYGAFFTEYPQAMQAVTWPVEAGIAMAEAGFASKDPRRISAALLLLSQCPGEVPPDASTELLQILLMAYLDGDYALDRLALDFECYLDAWGPDPQLRLDLVRLLEDGGMTSRAAYHMGILENNERP